MGVRRYQDSIPTELRKVLLCPQSLDGGISSHQIKGLAYRRNPVLFHLTRPVWY